MPLEKTVELPEDEEDLKENPATGQHLNDPLNVATYISVLHRSVRQIAGKTTNRSFYDVNLISSVMRGHCRIMTP